MHHGSKSFIYDGLSQNIYPVASIKICLEFAKIGQSTDENKFQLILSTNFGMVRMRTTTIFERFYRWSCLKQCVTPETMTDSKFLCYIEFDRELIIFR